MRLLLERVVLALCPDIACDIGRASFEHVVERDVRRELVGCLLASQVRHSTAVAWTSAFQKAGLLEDAWWRPQRSDEFRQSVVMLLAGEHPASDEIGRYRFFNVRAQQIANAHDILMNRPLPSFLCAAETIPDLRRTLVHEIPGLGPKQASMFLRNLGISDELAVLDRYVLRFMTLAGLLDQSEQKVGRMAEYESVERILVAYARGHGFAPGCMDWAIWATMKAAVEIGL